MQKKEIESVNETKLPQINYRNEKRIHLRLSIRLPIFCYCLTSKNYFFTYCKNISPGGMSLFSDVFSKLDEFMEFKIEFPGRTISCKGKIVSFKSFKDSFNKKVRVKFISMEPKNRDYINNFILEMNLHSEDMKS